MTTVDEPLWTLQGGGGCDAVQYWGDAMDVLRGLEAGSVNCCVTSPPYYGLRDYGVDGQIGLERTPEAYVARLVAVFREVRRVLRDDGTLWLNLGDSYSFSGKGGNPAESEHRKQATNTGSLIKGGDMGSGLPPKNLIGIPWMVAFALRADGWYLRSDIIWAKPNPMPESVRDRPTKAHEYIFLLSKSQRYFYDAAAIRNPPSPDLITQVEQGYNGAATKDFGANGAQDASAVKSRIIQKVRERVDKQRGHGRRHDGFNDRWDALTKAEQQALGSNKRTVWTVPPKPFPGAHFATFPPGLIEPCILAGAPEGGTVLDPFSGSGTTGMVALRHRRRAIMIELSPDYCLMAEERIATTIEATNNQGKAA
jgi:DNA modification methylase